MEITTSLTQLILKKNLKPINNIIINNENISFINFNERIGSSTINNQTDYFVSLINFGDKVRFPSSAHTVRILGGNGPTTPGFYSPGVIITYKGL